MRFSSVGLWKWFISGCWSALIGSIVKLCRVSPLGTFQHDYRPATLRGAPLALPMRVGMALPLRQSGSMNVSTGMMECWALRQVSRTLDFSATVSVPALYVWRAILVSVAHCGIKPKLPFCL